jgi:hypothetical protein
MREPDGTHADHDRHGVVEVGDQPDTSRGGDQADEPGEAGREEPLPGDRRDDARTEQEAGEGAPDRDHQTQRGIAVETQRQADDDREQPDQDCPHSLRHARREAVAIRARQSRR